MPPKRDVARVVDRAVDCRVEHSAARGGSPWPRNGDHATCRGGKEQPGAHSLVTRSRSGGDVTARHDPGEHRGTASVDPRVEVRALEGSATGRGLAWDQQGAELLGAVREAVDAGVESEGGVRVERQQSEREGRVAGAVQTDPAHLAGTKRAPVRRRLAHAGELEDVSGSSEEDTLSDVTAGR